MKFSCSTTTITSEKCTASTQEAEVISKCLFPPQILTRYADNTIFCENQNDLHLPAHTSTKHKEIQMLIHCNVYYQLFITSQLTSQNPNCTPHFSQCMLHSTTGQRCNIPSSKAIFESCYPHLELLTACSSSQMPLSHDITMIKTLLQS